MKFVIVFILICFNSFAWSLPIPKELDSLYSFKGQAEVQIDWREENVYSKSEVGKVRLKELREDNYTCVHVSNSWYRCKKFMHRSLPENILSEIRSEFSGLNIQIGERTEIDRLAHESEAYVEWLVSRSLTFNNESYKNFRYFISSKNLEKINFGESEAVSTKGLVIDWPNLLLIEKKVERSGAITDIYYVYVIFEPN